MIFSSISLLNDSYEFQKPFKPAMVATLIKYCFSSWDNLSKPLKHKPVLRYRQLIKSVGQRETHKTTQNTTISLKLVYLIYTMFTNL